MKLAGLLVASFALLGTVIVNAQETTTTNSTTRRYEWNSTTADEEAEAASEQVRADWTEALADYNPFEELTNLEKLQLYNEWKVEAWNIVMNNANARFKLHRDIKPTIKFYNTFAPKNSCLYEAAMLFERLGRAMNGVLSSSELDAEHDWAESTSEANSGSDGGRKLRGQQQRELYRCRPCGSGYACWQMCNSRRRRLEGDSDELAIKEETPENMEALVNAVAGELQEQCEKRLKDIAAFADIDHSCANVLKAIRCDVIANVWDAISIVVDGTEMLAADMIETKLAESAGSV